MLTVRLPEEMDKQLSQLAQRTHRTKSYYIKLAVAEFLEDHADYQKALEISERVAKGEEKTISYAEALKQYEDAHPLR